MRAGQTMAVLSPVGGDNSFTDAKARAERLQREVDRLERLYYVEVGGETFERRVLTLGPSNAEYTLVEDGIQEDEYVVTQGAYQVYLASLSTEEVGGHGHAH